ncbi:hypothetical protein [Labedella endophytica]|uniref:ATP/GTP-binding protein n=1 Tax=Labedella endophytica TaxID=1523160 RepID=A0A3S0WV68_9MICO|nr:hypothetical protein [Labedella endophytica]RUQ97561.1 hypothetical protein ELQ94_15460 [Labedella endophytica]
MPRSNRPRRSGAASSGREESDLSSLLQGWKRTEVRRGVTWSVQPISTSRAQKDYVCPGCGGTIDAGIAHVVAWRTDGPLGDAADLAARRHWHLHCWRIG